MKAGTAVVAFAWATGASAQGFAYGIDSSNDLYLVDLSNASSTFIGNVNGNGALYESLGFDASGILYGITVGGDLFDINTTNGFANYIGTTGLGNSEGMDWDATNGRMLISDFTTNPTVFEVNLTNATTQFVQTATSGSGVIRTLATRIGSKELDTRQDIGMQGDIHGTFDLGSGAYVNFGTQTPFGVLGIDYGTNGVLFGLTSTGDLISINPGNGAYQTVGTANAGSYFLGMATVVPEPGSMIVLTALLAGIAKRRKR